MAGRPFSAHSYRFANAIPANVRGLYLAEFGNGIVKVGQSSDIRTRLIGLNQTCRANGHQIGRFAAFVGCHQREDDCISAISGKAEVAQGHVEYFHGIGFDEALALVMPIVRPVTTFMAIEVA